MQHNICEIKVVRIRLAQYLAFPSEALYEAFCEKYWYLRDVQIVKYHTGVTLADILDTADAMREFFPEFYLRWLEEMSGRL